MIHKTTRESFSYNIDFQINNDGSLDVKESTNDVALVNHYEVDSQKNRMIRWRISLESPEIWKVDYDATGDTTLGQGPIYRFLTGPMTPTLQDVSFNGMLVRMTNSQGREIYIDLASQGASLGRIKESQCVEKKNGVRCQPGGTSVIYDPFGDSGFFFGADFSEEASDRVPLNIRNLFEHYSGKLFTVWHQVIWTRERNDREVQLADLAMVHTQEDHSVFALKEMLKLDPSQISMQGLRVLLGDLADRPEAYLHYEWLLLGVARLFEARQSCLKVKEAPNCIQEIQDQERLLILHRYTLAERLKPHLKESSYFPNEDVVTKAWAYLLDDEDFKSMLAFDPSKAAKALLLGIDQGLVYSLPKLSLSESALLNSALRGVLTQKRELAFAQSRSHANLPFALIPIRRYEELEMLVSQLFGSDVLPPPSKKDW